MSKWRHNNPSTARRMSAAAIVVTMVLFSLAGLSLLVGSRFWIVALVILAIVWVFFGYVLYFIGPRSGWVGTWWIRLPHRVEEIQPRIDQALRNASFHLHAVSATTRPKSRWLRNASVSFELGQGIRLWMIPGIPGSRAGLNPRLQPLTTLLITGLEGTSQDESAALRNLIQRAVEG